MRYRERPRIIKLTPATRKAVEKELLAVLNRWRRKYPAYIVRSCTDNSEVKYGRVKLMQRDVGFLLRIIGKAMESQTGEQI